LVADLPAGSGWQFEPKWDGFRCLAFRARGEVELKAKSGKSLARFFPEVLDNLRALPTQHFVLDGELVIPVDGTGQGAAAMHIRTAAARSCGGSFAVDGVGLSWACFALKWRHADAR
jgi:ATP-dependent DNA ligase